LENIISDKSIVSATKEQVSCEVKGEIVILSQSSGIYYGLNAVGAHIWNLIQKPMPVSNIREAVISEYEVEPDKCRRDIIDLLKELADAGLINVDAATHS
jgi:hypothetical protein